MAAKKILLPITRYTPLNLKILLAATQAQIQQAVTPSFRVAFGVNASSDDKQFIRRLMDSHPTVVLPESSSYSVDFSKPKEISDVLSDCDGVILSTGESTVANAEIEPFFQTEMNILQALTEVENVKDIIKVSCPAGVLGKDSTVEVGRQHWEIEQKLIEHLHKTNGKTLRLVRPNTQMECFLHGRLFQMIRGRTLSMSVKHGEVAFVHSMDVAEVINTLLHRKSDSAKSVEEYTLTGPEALTYQEVTKELSQAIGQTVRYSYFPLWAVQTALWIRGVRPDAITTEIQMARAQEAGAEQVVVSTIEELLKKPPRSFRQFALENNKMWPLASHK